MLFTTSTDGLRHRRLIVVGITFGLLLASFMAYALLVHRSATSPSKVTDSRPTRSPALSATPSGGSAIVELPALRPTRDPGGFARLVAHALFDWDTATVIGRTDHIERLVAVADPTGESSPGLVADISNYLPTEEAWSQLQVYETRQWIEVDSLTEPSLWPEAEAQAGPDGFLPGTAAYTITGVRHREGIWESAPVSSAHDVSFTVFMVCGPAYSECHLLRLSLVDEPLD